MALLLEKSLYQYEPFLRRRWDQQHFQVWDLLGSPPGAAVQVEVGGAAAAAAVAGRLR